MRGALKLFLLVLVLLRDHPRVCGEHSRMEIACDLVTGSSPRMRGAPPKARAFRRMAGIIPAYAGSTLVAARRSQARWDHPRVCGEHSNASSSISHHLGSSPRMRGAQCDILNPPRIRGIIPAYAGSTPDGRKARAAPQDHPRVCGEDMLPMASVSVCIGSSPRMRGAPLTDTSITTSSRIIPAYAGSTFK